MTTPNLYSDRCFRASALAETSKPVRSIITNPKPSTACIRKFRLPLLVVEGTLGFTVSRCSSRRKARSNQIILSPESHHIWSHDGARGLVQTFANLHSNEEPADDVQQSEAPGSQKPVSDFRSELESPSGSSRGGIPYPFVTGLGVVGFLETTYLSWSKISGASVTCTVGGSCTDVLDSSYAYVFGVPLAFIGMIAYGATAVLGGVRLSSTSFEWDEEEKWVRWLLLGITTAMGAASAYLMYILVSELEGASCVYCVTSAILSSALFALALRGFSLKDVAAMVGFQTIVGLSVVFGLSVAFGDSTAARDLDLPSVEPEVYTMSSAKEISLAKHLQSIGARMYGAFWCSHCYEQKQKFGREAMKYVDYVECYPDGYRKGVKIAEPCDAANVQGFPTWIINGKVLSGEQDLEDLARASGFSSSAT